jgi:hypothetical protein
VEVARFLRNNTPPGARIAVVGSEPQIYFYSDRYAATGYISAYPLVEDQPYATAMRAEAVREIEQANPEYVVFVNVDTSWASTSAPPDTSIFEWFDDYQKRKLRLIGAVEVMSDRQVTTRWFDAAEVTPAVPAEYTLAVFKRADQ